MVSDNEDHEHSRAKSLYRYTTSDFDEDGRITQEDIFKITDRLVLNHFLDSTAKEKICEVVSTTFSNGGVCIIKPLQLQILQEMDFLSAGYLNESEFQYAMIKLPNLAHHFRFRVWLDL